MERIKSNKYALLLFIASIATAVFTVVGIIVAIVGMSGVSELVKQEGQTQGLSQAEIDAVVSITVGAAYATLIIVAIIELFVVLCGLKCSMHGKWRIGAIVFGVLLCLDYVWAITRGGWMNWVSALIAGFYLVGAIVCKPDAPNAEVTE